MIVRHNKIYIGDVKNDNCLVINNNNLIYKDAIFFDLEHYVYKKPICVGVFGCCFFNNTTKTLEVTQYMIENSEESVAILLMAQEYFQSVKQKYNKKSIVTFSGNNDFTIINYLFEKYNVKYVIKDHYEHLDLQKQYEIEKNKGVGLKALEKEFGIHRDSELISGQNLAKTFSKIMKDENYIKRMPADKIEKILLYNEQDVVNLFHIYVGWKKVVYKEEISEEVSKVESNKDEFIDKREEKDNKYEDKKDKHDEDKKDKHYEDKKDKNDEDKKDKHEDKKDKNEDKKDKHEDKKDKHEDKKNRHEDKKLTENKTD